jgi:cytidylate kinase
MENGKTRYEGPAASGKSSLCSSIQTANRVGK